MTMGRPRKPDQLKALEGARIRSDKGDDINAIQVEIALPPCPAYIKGAARKHWQELGAALVASGLLSVIDGDVFAIHCSNVARLAEVEEKLEDLNAWLAKTPNGFQVQSGLLQIRNRLQEMVIKTAKEFGLTPAGRSGLKPTAPQQQGLFENNEFSSFS